MTSTTSVPAGAERCWNSFTEAELENADSRVVVGFHFRFACSTGVKVGRKVGRFAIRHSLRPCTRDAKGMQGHCRWACLDSNQGPTDMS